jgi:hypothetical protein
VFRAPKILRRNFHQNIARQKSSSSETKAGFPLREAKFSFVFIELVPDGSS